MLTVDWLASRIAEDFEARGVVAEVVYGSHKDALSTASRRVVVGLSPSFTFEPPDGPDAPGPKIIDTGDGEIAARSLMTRRQEVTLWVRGFPPEGTAEADFPLAAHTDTAALLHATLAAIYRAAHGSTQFIGGEWPAPDRQEFWYGSLVIASVSIGIPVLDIPLGMVTVQPANLALETAICEPSGCQTDVSFDPG